MLAKEAFQSVCTQIAQMYEQDGWKYSKSNHWMTRKTKNFTFQISFFTSYYNVSGEDVSFYGEFDIYMNKPKTQIWYLGTQQSGVPHGRMEWNVAKEELWEETIKEFTHWMEQECFPIMYGLENQLEEFVGTVVKQGFYPPKGYCIDFSFILQYGTKEQVQEAARRYHVNYGYIPLKKLNGIEVDMNSGFEDMQKAPIRVNQIDVVYDNALEVYCELKNVTPEEMNEEQKYELNLYAGNHIGFFVAWLIKHNYLSDKYKDCEGVQRVKEETMTGTEFLLEYCDGELWTDDMVEPVGVFACRYCKTTYFRDYIGWVLDELCDIPMEFIGTWEDYHNFEPVIDRKFEEFQKQ